jgi:hypothetical protein
MTAKRIALALVLSLTIVLAGAAGASAAVNVNLTVSGTGGVLVQVPHEIGGTIVGYTTEDACTVDPAHPLKQGEKINCETRASQLHDVPARRPDRRRGLVLRRPGQHVCDHRRYGPVPRCPWDWSGAAARSELRRLAARAGVRRRFAPHQLRHPTPSSSPARASR